MTYTEKAIAGTWYTITCTAATTVTQEIEGETATLATLDESGTASFRATSPTITIETTGKYHILPTKAPAAGGIGGGGNTAAETAALVESNNTAKQVAANGAGINNLLERVGTLSN